MLDFKIYIGSIISRVTVLFIAYNFEGKRGIINDYTRKINLFCVYWDIWVPIQNTQHLWAVQQALIFRC